MMITSTGHAVKLDELYRTQKDVKELLKHSAKIKKLPEVHDHYVRSINKNKVVNTILIVAIGIVVIGGFAILFGIKDLSLMDMRVTVARYQLIDNAVNHNVVYKDTWEKVQALYATKGKLQKQYTSTWDRLTEDEVTKYSSLLYIYKLTEKIDDDYFTAITAAESEFNKHCESKAGAKGLNQLMEETFECVNKTMLFKFGNIDIWDVYHNTEASLRHLTYLDRWFRHKLGRSPSQLELAWAYNGGQTVTLKAIKSGDPEKFLPYETRQYGEKVLFYYRHYRDKEYNVWYYADKGPKTSPTKKEEKKEVKKEDKEDQVSTNK